MTLRRDDLPKDYWKHRYQIGYRMGYRLGLPWVMWRNVTQAKLLDQMYNRGYISPNSHPEDLLSTLHAGAVMDFGQKLFRARRA